MVLATQLSKVAVGVLCLSELEEAADSADQALVVMPEAAEEEQADIAATAVLPAGLEPQQLAAQVAAEQVVLQLTV